MDATIPCDNTLMVTRWGNSEGVRLPKAFCRQLGISVGDVVSARIEGDAILIEKRAVGATIHERMKRWDGVPLCEPEIDWGTSQGEEL